ncbi:hypothetical protein Fcan01_28497 [Folsomia candida]|uniref:Uncharacterized protein n=1 Tax=Folsomia candida TaxID=158441 RepID=A0A226CTH6_FOLCA|nr:hypothetical protein Fcan01_28497 [Folsomia candida]
MEAYKVLKIVLVLFQLVKLVLNSIVIYIYRKGDNGYFMGASYNKNHDAEAYVAATFIGYITFNKAQLIGQVFNYFYNRRSFYSRGALETVMLVYGIIAFLFSGVIILHFWLKFIPANHFTENDPACVGIWMGSLSIVLAVMYLVEIVVSQFMNSMSQSGDNRGGGIDTVDKGRVVQYHGVPANEVRMS